MIRDALYNTMRIIKEKLPVNPADHIKPLFLAFLPKIKRKL
jgi:hypothetical protein